MTPLTAHVQFRKLAWQYNIPRISLTLKAFLCTHRTDLYSSLMYIALRVPQAVYTNYEDPWCPVY